jgi:hypothetical protein
MQLSIYNTTWQRRQQLYKQCDLVPNHIQVRTHDIQDPSVVIWFMMTEKEGIMQDSDSHQKNITLIEIKPFRLVFWSITDGDSQNKVEVSRKVSLLIVIIKSGNLFLTWLSRLEKLDYQKNTHTRSWKRTVRNKPAFSISVIPVMPGHENHREPEAPLSFGLVLIISVVFII